MATTLTTAQETDDSGQPQPPIFITIECASNVRPDLQDDDSLAFSVYGIRIRRVNISTGDIGMHWLVPSDKTSAHRILEEFPEEEISWSNHLRRLQTDYPIIETRDRIGRIVETCASIKVRGGDWMSAVKVVLIADWVVEAQETLERALKMLAPQAKFYKWVSTGGAQYAERIWEKSDSTSEHIQTHEENPLGHCAHCCSKMVKAGELTVCSNCGIPEGT